MNDDVFCKIINGELTSYTCYEDDVVKCIMDASPASAGHTLIIPKKHYTDILEIDKETEAHIYDVAKIIMRRMLKHIPSIDGVVTLINYGKPQKVKHYHMHLIPTYLKECKLSQEEICELLKRA